MIRQASPEEIERYHLETSELAKSIVLELVKDLHDRCGVGPDSVDENTRLKIVDAWIKIIAKKIEGKNGFGWSEEREKLHGLWRSGIKKIVSELDELHMLWGVATLGRHYNKDWDKKNWAEVDKRMRSAKTREERSELLEVARRMKDLAVSGACVDLPFWIKF